MLDDNFDPKRIRKCQLVDSPDGQLIQFIAVGDKHKMIKHENGEVEMIKLPEHGKEYKYHKPVSLDYGLDLLDEGHFETHREIARQIRKHLGH